MSKVCEICGRGTTFGNQRSHSNISTRRTFGINIQAKKIDGKKKRVCARCIKTLAKVK